jgi:hypothetical protein
VNVDKRTCLGFVAGAAALLGGAALVVSCLDQPRTKCQTGRGVFAAKYLLLSAVDGGCVLPGEQIGIQPYNPATPDNTKPDIERSSVAIRGTQTADALRNRQPDSNPEHLPYALGNFATAEPGPDDFCTVPTFQPSIQELGPVPAIDAGADGGGGRTALPAVTIKYDWKNVRFFVTAAQTGVQMIGDLTFTKDDCTADYRVTALYPATDCSTVLEDGGPRVAAPEKCLPPDLDKGRRGSAINSDVATVCDPVLLLCVLAKEPPSNH